ncbi:MAG: serine/threonine-protein kinase [Polyangiales bacterium]
MPEAHVTKVCPRCGTRYDAQATFCQRDGGRLEAEVEEVDPYLGKVLVDQFRIDAVLGAGGMGTVYRARQLSLGRDVAVKILHRDLVQNVEAFKRFQREVRTATSVEHPNVVRVFLYGQLPDGNLYLVMEYLDGRPLSEVLATEGALPLPRALHVLEQIGRGLGAAHASGIVHRDVKPENVLLVAEGDDPDVVKILDFGIARSLESDSTGLTQTGVIFGTARYMSPEGAQGEPTDARSDVYSLGVLAYQLLVGETPFEGNTPVALLMQHVQAKPIDLRTRPRGRDVPAPIAELVMRCLSKKKGARPADGNAFADALVAAAQASRALASAPDDLAVPGLSRRAPRRLSPPWRVGLVLLASFVLGAGIAGAIAFHELAKVPTDDLPHRAAAALARGALDSPPGDNVRELTDAMLAASPGDPEATRLRHAAAEQLRADATAAHARGDLAAARSRLERARVFVPEDGEIADELRALDAEASAAGRMPGVRVTPSSLGPRRPFVVEVVPPLGVTDVMVEILHGRRRAAAAHAEPRPDGTFVATLTLERAGRYVVEVRAGNAILRDELEITGPRDYGEGPVIFQGSSP